MLYRKEISLDVTVDKAWDFISDLRNFGRFNPHHYGVKFLTENCQGEGTTFTTRHTFWPIFPIPSLETRCVVTSWEKNEFDAAVVVDEQPYVNIRIGSIRVGNIDVPLTNHIQRYFLDAEGSKTNYIFEVEYKGVPAWIPPWFKHVNTRVEKVMINELESIKKHLENEKRP